MSHDDGQSAKPVASAAPSDSDSEESSGTLAPEATSLLLVGSGLIAVALSSRRLRRPVVTTT